MRIHRKTHTRGFSLVEVVIAIGIVAILLTTFMAVFGPAQKNINRAISISDANRLVSTLENEMAVLRPGEESKYTVAGGDASAFEKAFQWIKDGGDPTKAVIIYQYHALPSGTPNSDDSLKAAESEVLDKRKLPGKDYITQTVARSLGEASDKRLIKTELKPGVVGGNVYVVRMTQLVKDSNSGNLVVGDVGTIRKSDGSSASDSADYDEAHITLQVEFFQLANNLAAYVTGGAWDFEKLGAPVATHNLAVRR